MPRIIETTAYRFNELSDTAKKKAIENNRCINTLDGNFYCENTLELWQSVLSAIGFKNAKIAYSGFSSQGDGACLTSCDFEISTFLKFAANPPMTDGSCGDESPQALAGWLVHKIGAPTNMRNEAAWLGYGPVDDYFQMSISRASGNAGHYYHYNSYRFDGFEDTLPEVNDVVAVFARLSDDIESYRKTICKAIYRDLEADYDYATSDDAVIEAIQEDFEFTIDGSPA